tara:strand:- start:5581 stop:5934 length:354 start_codon:yes stop_codon:yes gene_type:complete
VAFFPQYLRLVYVGNDPIKIGVYGLPLGLGTVLGSALAGGLTTRFGHTRAALTIGIALQTLFIGLMALPNGKTPWCPDVNLLKILPSLPVSQMGTALAFSAISGIGIGKCTCFGTND